MEKPKFSVVLIAKNEENTLPKCVKSLSRYQERGGEIVLLDTGSTDKTVSVAQALGCQVIEVGETFKKTITDEEAKAINDRFIVGNEAPIVNGGSKLFDFAAARNFVTSKAENDMVCTMDCDEVYTNLDIDKINALIDEGYQQFEYQFVFAHDNFGRPAVQFVQSKFFDRRVMQWTGIVHEVLQGEARRTLLPAETIFLEHWQEPGKEHRGNYLVGLALDCFQNPTKDRQSHYLAREMVWTGRPKSALKEFERHIQMNGWLAERAQSMIYMGDCYGALNDHDNQAIWYTKAFQLDPNRREALIKLAKLAQRRGQHLAAIAYAKGAMEIPWTDYYANDRAMYSNLPHELLYRSYGWVGNIPKAQEHILAALKIQPYNGQYLEETKYYFEYPSSKVDGWMTYEEQLWLYEMAKDHFTIGELGSWKGRSTNALATSCRGTVTAIDTWQGSDFVGDSTNWMAKQEDVFATFLRNTAQFKNIDVNRNRGMTAVKDYADKSFDVVFIDAGHTYEEVRDDIDAWLPKAKMILCGHDYQEDIWMGVVKAVDDKFGKPDGVAGSIWYKYLVPKVTFIVPTLGRPEGLKRCLDSIKALNYPKAQIEVIVIDGEGTVPQKVARGLWQSKGEYIVYASNDVEFTANSLYEALRAGAPLTAFNTGPLTHDQGNICEHFIIKKDFVKEIGGEIFDTEFHHVGCDNLLWAKAQKLGKASRCETALVAHHHFSKGAEYDDVYKKGWSHVDEDRALLAKKLAEMLTKMAPTLG